MTDQHAPLRMFLAAILVLGFGVTARGADLHVSPTGDDARDCGSPATACLTLQRAVDVAAASGDVIHVDAGRHVGIVTIDKDLTVMASAADAVLDGDGVGPVVEIAAGTEVRLVGLTITGGDTWLFGGGVVNSGQLTLDDCTVTANSSDVGGGGISNMEATLTLLDSRVTDNEADTIAGGIENFDGTLVIERSTISGNTCRGSAGGIASTGPLTLIDSTVSDNEAISGGGLHVGAGDVWLDGTTVSGNVAQNAAGIYNNGTMTLNNCTISDNDAATGGGGIATTNRLSVYNTTITGNRSAFTGGGLDNGFSSVWVKNSIISGNTALHGPDCEGQVESEGYVLIGDPAGCTLTGDLTGNLTDVDPLLGPLADNGGPTLTHDLLDGSPAIDAGDPAGCLDGDGAPLDTDQRGAPRPADCGGGPRCDMGAVEACRAVVPRGACCDGSACTLETEADCLAIPGAVFAGDGTDCADDPCGPSGVPVHESTVPDDLGAPVGMAATSPYDHLPSDAPLLFYVLGDDISGPELIFLEKGGRGLLIHF